MPTEWAKHLKAGRRAGTRKSGKKNRSNKRVYYHSLRQRLKNDLRNREE